MHPLVTPSARTSDQGLVPMSSVDDLHEADLELLLADRLAETDGALRAVVARISRFV